MSSNLKAGYCQEISSLQTFNRHEMSLWRHAMSIQSLWVIFLHKLESSLQDLSSQKAKLQDNISCLDSQLWSLNAFFVSDNFSVKQTGAASQTRQDITGSFCSDMNLKSSSEGNSSFKDGKNCIVLSSMTTLIDATFKGKWIKAKFVRKKALRNMGKKFLTIINWNRELSKKSLSQNAISQTLRSILHGHSFRHFFSDIRRVKRRRGQRTKKTRSRCHWKHFQEKKLCLSRK